MSLIRNLTLKKVPSFLMQLRLKIKMYVSMDMGPKLGISEKLSVTTSLIIMFGKLMGLGIRSVRKRFIIILGNFWLILALLLKLLK